MWFQNCSTRLILQQQPWLGCLTCLIAQDMSSDTIERPCHCSLTLLIACPAEVCKQQVPRGWTFNSRKDSSGNDIGYSAAAADGNWTKAAAVCGANPYCLGVNTNGWLKKAILSPAQWSTSYDDPCQGLLVKQSECRRALAD